MLNKEVWKARFKKLLSLDNNPAHISAGFAIGVFISFTPFFGFHTLLAIAAAFIFRVNKVACVTGSLVNTPLTIAPALGLSFKLGRILRGLPPIEMKIKEIEWFQVKMYVKSLLMPGHILKGGEWVQLRIYAKSLILGSSIIGLLMAVISYFVCYWVIVRFRARNKALGELTKEMENTGEGLEE
ncbi:MAG: DUF2062 domain-containing protein [Desulfuromonadales bacterium]|nr:DUF2062 domain-containing protein [Desulfuromonadales bacterium]